MVSSATTWYATMKPISSTFQLMFHRIRRCGIGLEKALEGSAAPAGESVLRGLSASREGDCEYSRT